MLQISFWVSLLSSLLHWNWCSSVCTRQRTRLPTEGRNSPDYLRPECQTLSRVSKKRLLAWWTCRELPTRTSQTWTQSLLYLRQRVVLRRWWSMSQFRGRTTWVPLYWRYPWLQHLRLTHRSPSNEWYLFIRILGSIVSLASSRVAFGCLPWLRSRGTRCRYSE